MKFIRNLFARLFATTSTQAPPQKRKEDSLVDLGKISPYSTSRGDRRRSTNCNGRTNIQQGLLVASAPTQPRSLPKRDERGTPIIRATPGVVTHSFHNYHIAPVIASADIIVTGSALAFSSNSSDDDLDIIDAVSSVASYFSD